MMHRQKWTNQLSTQHFIRTSQLHYCTTESFMEMGVKMCYPPPSPLSCVYTAAYSTVVIQALIENEN